MFVSTMTQHHTAAASPECGEQPEPLASVQYLAVYLKWHVVKARNSGMPLAIIARDLLKHIMKLLAFCPPRGESFPTRVSVVGAQLSLAGTWLSAVRRGLGKCVREVCVEAVGHPGSTTSTSESSSKLCPPLPLTTSGGVKLRRT